MEYVIGKETALPKPLASTTARSRMDRRAKFSSTHSPECRDKIGVGMGASACAGRAEYKYVMSSSTGASAGKHATENKAPPPISPRVNVF
mmetsp:Transcript_1760/g.3881  ORF Transcript_1760/g.3881 Transcript_1760/m.3881 type:complete len:90 (+) Transcript_1760:548-817(+)